MGDDPLRVPLGARAQFIVAQHLQINQPIAEKNQAAGKQNCQRPQSEKLNGFLHYFEFTYRPRRSVPPPNRPGRR